MQHWVTWAPLPAPRTKENLVMVAYLHSHPVGARQEDYCITPAQVTQVCSVSKKTTTKPKKTLKS